MKKLTYIATIAGSLFLTTSCVDLTQEPQSFITEEEYFASMDLEGIKQAATALYTDLWNGNYGFNCRIQRINVCADDITYRAAKANNELANYYRLSPNITANTADFDTTWSLFFAVINNANKLINNTVIPSDAQEAEAFKNVLGEAYFLRGLAYFYLVRMYGDVPLKTIASTSEGISMPRTPREEVFKQIVQDLTDALAISEDPLENERASRWTVKAYLGKAYHKMASLGIDTQQNLENAKTYFDDVYGNGPYELEADFSYLFGEWVTGSKEAIFQINFIGDPSAYYNRGSNRLCPQASTSGINWTTYSFSFSAYNLHAGTYPGDPRIKTTFLTSWRERGGNNQANPKPQVGPELSPNDSVYAYPYLVYTVPEVYVLDANGDPVMENNKPVLQEFVTMVPQDMSLEELLKYLRIVLNRLDAERQMLMGIDICGEADFAYTEKNDYANRRIHFKL